MKLWSGVFNKATDHAVEVFTASIGFDHLLANVDILCSLAHVKTLAHASIITQDEASKLTAGLHQVSKKIKAGEAAFSVQDEDIHMNIEKLLHQEIGELAGKLHTGRSRNDQVATDVHLYLRYEVLAICDEMMGLQQALIEQANNHVQTIMPGYTHLQRAQPISFAHHLLSYAWMLQRDFEKLIHSWGAINTMPLGAGALAGSGFPIDREYCAKLLGFETIYENSLDAVSDRDFVVEFLSNASLVMLHLSRLSEEIILWCSSEFQFVKLDEAYCTGSSMMPQKQNPDVAELVRGKTGRVFGALFSLLTLMKGLPLAYNKDMQEDKEGLFDTIKTLRGSLSLYAPMIKTMQVNSDNMRKAVQQDFSNATQIADYLVAKDVPFREAHAVSGQLVKTCLAQQKYLLDLSLDDMQQVHPLIEQDVFEALQPEAAINARSVRGGTGFNAVEKQLQIIQQKMTANAAWLQHKQQLCEVQL